MSEPKIQVHLFRGASSVRGWSKYQETVYRWTLCGINRKTDQPSVENAAHATEDPVLVTCGYCQQLMRSGDVLAAGKKGHLLRKSVSRDSCEVSQQITTEIEMSQ